jgi:2-haloacid dehalogenase
VDLSDFDALSFDCYGTLIDWEAGIAAVLGPWAQAAGLDLSTEELLAVYAGHEAQVEADQPGLLYPDVLAASFVAVGAELGTEVSPGDAQALAGSVPQWPAFADSHDALVSLGERYQLIILSNVDRTSFAGSNARLDVTFDAIITAQDVGSYKPSPRNFEALLARTSELGVAPGRLLHVAQSLFHDHVQAKAFGLPTVWINRRRDRPGWGATPEPAAAVVPDWEFGSMAEFAATAKAARA